MTAVDDLIARVIKREGGYVYNSADAGGPTKYGITLATLHEWRGKPVGALDVAGMTETEAAGIYRSRYFVKPGLDCVTDPAVLELLFDFGVNSGPAAAVCALQKVLHVTVDGDFGPASRLALSNVSNMPALFYAIKCERYELELRYVGRRPSNAQFAEGWSNRNDQFEMSFT